MSVTNAKIDAELDKSNFILRGIGSWFGNAFRKAPKPEPSGKAHGRVESSTALVASGSHSHATSAPAGMGGGSADTSLRVHTAAALRGKQDAATLREEELLASLSQSVGRLKESGSAAGVEIERQNAMLDEYSERADITIARIDAATRKAEKLAR